MLRYFKYSSQVLRGNAMGNSCERALAVLLPANYSPDKTYPTLWMLDGYLGNGFSMLADPGALGSSLCTQLLQFQADQLMPPSIFVFPDPSTLLGGSQYINSPACGRFMDHLVDELVPFVESQLSCVASPHGRVLCGHSSGGYGALVVPMLRPGIFGHSIVSAADSMFEHSLRPSFAFAGARLKKAGSVKSFLAGLFALTRPDKCSKEDFHTLMTLAMASCYSPLTHNKELADIANAPHFSKLPFEIDTLEEIPEVWALWKSWDPVELVKKHGSALKSLHHLHLDAGTEDEFCAQYGHRKISESLKKLGVKHECTEFAGGHSGTSFRYAERFKMWGEIYGGL